MNTTGKALLKYSIVFAVALAFMLPAAAMAPKAPVAKAPQGIHALDPEWIEQATGFSTPSRGINYVSAVDENVVWAAAYDGTAPTAACNDYTMTTNGGTTWTPGAVTGATGLSSAMIFALDANTAWDCMYYVDGGTQGIYKTTNGGATWARQTTAVFDSNLGAFPDCIHFFDANNGWCMGDPTSGYFEIYTTTDGGTTWNRVPSSDIAAPLSGEWGVVGYYSAIGDNIWFGTELGRVYHSADRGYTWTAAQTTLGAYTKPVFKDALNGLAIDLNSAATAELSETSDGGANWAAVTMSGTCSDNDLCYIPGTTNTYYSTGAASTGSGSGASYSDDGGHTWTDFADQAGVQMMNMGFVANKLGWAGAFNTDDVTGGIWKHLAQTNPEPTLTVSITGGTGFTVKVSNVGDGDATGVAFTATITGGLFMKQRSFSGTIGPLAKQTFQSQTFTVMGIGLGIIKKPVPVISATATCTEGKTGTASINAKIFLSKVTVV